MVKASQAPYKDHLEADPSATMASIPDRDMEEDRASGLEESRASGTGIATVAVRRNVRFNDADTSDPLSVGGGPYQWEEAFTL